MNSKKETSIEDERQELDVPKNLPMSNQRDRTEPLDNPSQEAVAQFLAAPEGMADFASVTALASQLGISRATVYRWERDLRVSQRIQHLSLKNKVAGDLFVRRNWLKIMETVVTKAISGDLQAMKFSAACAWPESSGVDQGLSLSEMIRMTENTGSVPSWLLESRAAEEKPAQEADAPSEARGLPEPIR